MTKDISVTASAEETSFQKGVLEDENFRFEMGAAVKNVSDVINELGFSLYLKDPKLLDFCDNEKDSVVLSFIVFHDLGEGNNPIPLYEIVCVANGFNLVWMHKVLAFDENVNFEGITFSPKQHYDNGYKDFIDYRTGEETPPMADEYTVDFIQTRFHDLPLVFKNNKNPFLRFVVQLNSNFESYFVRFSYRYRNFVRHDNGFLGIGAKDVYSTVAEGSIDSDTRSIFGIIDAINKAGEMSEEFGTEDSPIYQAAMNILKSGYLQEVTVEYLERIKGTPFAKKVQKNVKVPVLNAQISSGDGLKAIGYDALTPLGSTLSHFEKSAETGVYVAKYCKNIWLEARGVDGNTLNVFLDCNLSYEDYFNTLKKDEFGEGLYEWCWSRMVEEYPSLLSEDGLNGPGTVYGYFGLVPIPKLPELGSVDALMANLIDVETETYGKLSIWNYTEILTIEAYDTLLTEYKYSFLDRVWDTAWNLVTNEQCSATYYLFYLDDIATKKIVISENGIATPGENDGVLENTAQLVAKETGELIKDTIEDTTASVGNFFSSIQNTTRAIIVIVATLAILFGGVFVWLKILRPLTRSANGDNSKKSND